MKKIIKKEPKTFKIKLNGKLVLAYEGETVLTLARRNKINIPSFCYHPDLSVKANCRVCVVEIKGSVKLKTSCSTLVEEGMEIITDNERVKKARETNLELIYASHVERCGGCSYRFDCNLLSTAKEYDLEVSRFKDRKKTRKTYKFANAVEIDGTQCIDCRNCLEACVNQGISYLELSGKGIDQEIVPKKDKKFACVYCGQCALHCPVASAQEQDQSLELEKLLKLKGKTVVVQFAPAVRVSLGESFGLPYGTNCEGKIVSALKKLGFNYIFDINFAADITTMTEAEEFMERLADKKAIWPMTTSCCPAWVAYAEFYHPELLPHLTTARSPHIHGGGAIKAYWAKKKNLKAEDIIVVSVVPCTAKKYEAIRPELKYKGKPLVDFVLTTRELAFLIKKNRIDFVNLPDGKLEPMFNAGSGAAAIYGASGGVMESALRSVASFVCEKGKDPLCDARLEFKEVRGLEGIKEAEVKLGGKKYKLAVVNGLGNFSKLLPNFSKYHYIEVMACPGGCLGGGGQPIPTTKAIKEKRMAGLYNLDKKRTIRRAHENKEMLAFYNFAKENGLAKQLLHTGFKKSKGSILTSTKDNN
ncbi:ferredoxin [Candidatus Falkowbacteria bacterium]|nr:ferredoxin [Candidatus Falkowbacteria bacterium]NCT54563.1 ferredoxin [Candidatus Falkowbacteria bacterium]